VRRNRSILWSQKKSLCTRLSDFQANENEEKKRKKTEKEEEILLKKKEEIQKLLLGKIDGMNVSKTPNLPILADKTENPHQTKERIAENRAFLIKHA